MGDASTAERPDTSQDTALRSSLGKPQTEKGKEIQFAFSQKRHEQKRTGGFTHRAPPQGTGVYPSKAPEVQGKSMTTTQMLEHLNNRMNRLENQGGPDQADVGLQGEAPAKKLGTGARCRGSPFSQQASNQRGIQFVDQLSQALPHREKSTSLMNTADGKWPLQCISIPIMKPGFPG